MKVYSAVIKRCPQTGLFVGFVPGFPGAHSQGETLDEVNHNLRDVIAMLLEDGEPMLERSLSVFKTSPSLEAWAIFPSSSPMK
ncbi:MAG: type II toxin-antitoxin system HicB family antitoxin [Sulfuricellaceae bacterium]|nr:type II toxin-antitoxin system HicB family antitoxin [Sulfuricellaceae bacterium]